MPLGVVKDCCDEIFSGVDCDLVTWWCGVSLLHEEQAGAKRLQREKSLVAGIAEAFVIGNLTPSSGS